MSHGHLAPAGLGDGGARYRVLGRLLHDVPRPGLQAPLEAAGLVPPGAGAPVAPLAHLAALSTLHGLLKRGEAIRTFLVAAPFVQVEICLALGAEVFAEARLTVVYPAPGAHVDLRGPHAVVAGGAGVEALAVLTHPLAAQEQEELGLAVDAAVVLGAHGAALADRVRSIAGSLISSPAMRLRLTVAVLHTVQHDKSK